MTVVYGVTPIPIFGEMTIHENATVTTIDSAGDNHFLVGFALGHSHGVTFSAGKIVAITTIADAGGGDVTVTATAHGNAVGDVLSITGTTNYNAIYTVQTVPTANTFTVTATWGVSETGTMRRGDCLIMGEVPGDYQMSYNLSMSSATTNQTFEFHMVESGVLEEHSVTRRKFANSDTGSVAGSTLETLGANARMQLAVKNTGGTGNFTPVHANVSIHRV